MTVVSVQPTFYCNLGCPYCYLGNLRNKFQLLDLYDLRDKLLPEILSRTKITTIDIFGGEISILPSIYLEYLFKICLEYCNSVNVTSNLFNLDILETLKKFPKVNLAISWNKERSDCPRIEEILDNQNKYFKNLDNKKQILTVALPSLLKEDPKKILDRFEKWNLPVTILRYFPSEENALYNLTTKDYEDFLIKILETYLTGNYTFPLNNHQQLLKVEKEPLMTSNLFIQPSGEYSWISYDGNKEVYLHDKNIENWEIDSKLENFKYREKCLSCAFYNCCLAEHLNFNDITESSCCGLKNLLKWWYEKGIYLG